MALEEKSYSSGDFKQAVSALLPIGDYWQYQAGDDLDKLLVALGDEFKTIHDETKISILYQVDNIADGWKLADYQTILNDNDIVGTVYDDSSTPNLIYIDIDHSQASGNLMQELDEYRLPHTAFCFKYINKQTMHVAVTRQSLQINRHTMTSVWIWGLPLGQKLVGTTTLGV